MPVKLLPYVQNHPTFSRSSAQMDTQGLGACSQSG